jgi:chromosome segregation ATPase
MHPAQKKVNTRAADKVNSSGKAIFTKVQHYRDRLSIVNHKKSKLTKEIEMARSQLLELTTLRKALDKRFVHLQSSLEHVHGEYSNAEDEKSDAFKKLLDLEIQIASLEGKRNSLESALKSVKDEFVKSDQSNQILREKIELLENKIELNQRVHDEDVTTICQLKSELKKMKQMKTSFQGDSGRIEKHLGENREKIRELEEALSLLEMSKQKTERDLASEKNVIEEQRQKIALLENQISQFNEMTHRFAEEKRINAQSLGHIGRLEEELALEKALKESISSDLEEALLLIETLTQEKDEILNESEAIKHKYADFEEMIYKVERIEQEKAVAIDTMKRLNEQLETTLGIKEKIEKDLERLRSKLNTHSETLNDLVERTDNSSGLPDDEW